MIRDSSLDTGLTFLLHSSYMHEMKPVCVLFRRHKKAIYLKHIIQQKNKRKENLTKAVT